MLNHDKISPMRNFALFYSYLNASAGFNLEACRAGRTPETLPTTKENNKAPKIKVKLKLALKKGVPNCC